MGGGQPPPFTMRIKFIREYRVKDELGTIYKEGKSLDVSEASARHFINRNAAIELGNNRKRAKPDKGTSKLLPGARKRTGNK